MASTAQSQYGREKTEKMSVTVEVDVRRCLHENPENPALKFFVVVHVAGPIPPRYLKVVSDV